MIRLRDALGFVLMVSSSLAIFGAWFEATLFGVGVLVTAMVINLPSTINKLIHKFRKARRSQCAESTWEATWEAARQATWPPTIPEEEGGEDMNYGKSLMEDFMSALEEEYPLLESVTHVTDGLWAEYLILSVGGQSRQLHVTPYYLDNRAYVLRLYDEVDAIMLGFKHSLMQDVPKRRILRRHKR